MIYLKVKWNHSFSDEPVLLYSELDRERWEVRKVEVFPGGRMAYAGPGVAVGRGGIIDGAKLAPSLNVDPPSGDLQSSQFRLCVAQCMGRL